ncbi:MAG: EamA family transporter [Chloroflexota bacterium]
MTPFVILIVICSTFMHASWNLLARYEHSESLFYRRMLIFILVAGFIPAVLSELKTHSLTPLAWLCVTGSGFSAGMYMFFLAKAYESSDFTIVYPVARSLPVIFIGIIDTLRGRPLTLWGWTGILLVTAGCILVPQISFKSFAWRNYINRTSLLMLLTAAGTIGYTYLDKIAAEVVQQGPDTAARYGYMYFAISTVPYLLFLKLFPSRQTNGHPHKLGWVLVVLAAFLSFGAYWLILWAYQLSPYASYIVAFRQFSIVIGAILAFVIYKEKGIAIRLTGASLITSGLLVIALWGR